MYSFINFLCVCIFLYCVVLILTAYYGERKLFFPVKDLIDQQYKFEEFEIEGVHGRFYHNFPKRRTILYCHGNGGNLTHRDYAIDLCMKYKLNILLFDYQGYGNSMGKAFQYSLHPDSQTAYNFLISKKIKSKNIIIWGESLGGNPATFLAENNKCGALVLLSTFSSVKDVINDYNKTLWNIGRQFLELAFDPIDTKLRLKNITVPVIIIHSKEDEFIPFENAVRLFNSIEHKNKKLIDILGDHLQPKMKDEKIDLLMRYLNSDDLNNFTL